MIPPRKAELPKTEADMITWLYATMTTRLYGLVTKAAVKRRLTEADIAAIERGIVDLVQISDGVAEEFQTFQAETAYAKARQLFQEYCNVIRNDRLKGR